MPDNKQELKVIAHIRTDFPAKFGIPRQSGLVNELKAQIIFEPEYRVPEAFRGIEGFSHLWLLWEFSEARREKWSPTVRPPRLGGNTRIGVFATRSPYRPNNIGLSSVKLEKVELNTPDGPILTVSGADLLDGTPIYDIKPYLPFTDSHPEAIGGYATEHSDYRLNVCISDKLLTKLPENKIEALYGILAQDPRPSYQNDPERLYGLEFAGFEVKFTVDGDTLTVQAIESV